MSISFPTSLSLGHSRLPISKSPKFRGEEAESSRRAEKRPLEDIGESSGQAPKRLQLEEQATDTFFRAFLDEMGAPAELSQPPQRPVQDPNVHMLNPQFYQPLMARHGKELLADAVRHYTSIKNPERRDELSESYYWIMRLLKNGADPNSTPPEVPVINRALNNGKFELFKKMKAHGAHTFPLNITLKIREHLFKLIQQIDRENTSQQRAAIDNAIAQTIPHLNMPGMNLSLPEWPKPNKPPSSRRLLHWAANKGHLPLTRTILNAGVPVDVCAEHGTPLEEILPNVGSRQVSLGNPLGVADALIAANADVNRRNIAGKSLLSRALEKDDVAFSEKLIDAGANPNTPLALTQKAPLHQVISARNKALTEKLLANGADVNAQTVTGLTPLIQAIKGKNLDIAESILEHPQLNVDLADNEGRTPLSYAAALQARNADTIVRKLLNKGANPVIASKSGKTPLIYAIEKKRDKNVQALVLGCSTPETLSTHLDYASTIVNQADGSGIKPLVWAKTSDSPSASMIKLLEEYTQDPLILPPSNSPSAPNH